MLSFMLYAEPSPLVEAAVYMGGILAGYLLLTEPHEWAWVRDTVREVWSRRRGR